MSVINASIPHALTFNRVFTGTRSRFTPSPVMVTGACRNPEFLSVGLFMDAERYNIEGRGIPSSKVNGVGIFLGCGLRIGITSRTHGVLGSCAAHPSARSTTSSGDLYRWIHIRRSWPPY